MSSPIPSHPPVTAPPACRPVLRSPEEETQDLHGRLKEGMLYVAHEAKTALSVIDVVLSMAQRSITAGRLPSPTDLETARAALRRASALLEGALAYGGVRPPKREPVNLVEIIGSVADMLRVVARAEAAAGRPVDVIERYCGPRCTVEGDRALLEAALLNLAFNSFQALGTQGGTVYLAQTCDGDAAQISVRDTGPGFPVAPGSDPVVPFRSTRAGGLGLGLPIAQAVIEAHSGTLTLRNPDEGGAEAVIRLPLNPSQPW